MSPLEDNGLVNGQRIGGYDRPLSIVHRRRFPQAAGRELIAVAGRHPHYLVGATIQGYPEPPRLFLFAKETPQLIDSDPFTRSEHGNEEVRTCPRDLFI